LNCNNCGAPLTPCLDNGYLRCDYCGSLCFLAESEDRVRSLGEASELNCALCGVPLLQAYVDQAPALYCPQCRGLLIRQPAFAKAIAYLRATAPDPPVTPPAMNREDLRRRITCPQCGRVMDTHAYGGPGNIVIDNCPRCHLNWLDYGEFSRIVDAPGRDRRGRRR